MVATPAIVATIVVHIATIEPKSILLSFRVKGF
jgi:hypothetical protein